MNAAFATVALIGSRRHNPHFQIGFDLLVQVNFDCVQAKFLQRTLQTPFVIGDGDFAGLKGCYDFNRSHATVEMTFIVCVLFNRKRLLSNFISPLLEPSKALLVNHFQLCLIVISYLFLLVCSSTSHSSCQ